MKKLVFIIVIGLLFGGCVTIKQSGQPFAGRTKCKTLSGEKKMTNRQVRKAQENLSYYHRVNGKMKKR